MIVSKFARTFRLFERMFPPSSGAEMFLPGEVSDRVQLIADPFARFALNGAVFRQDFQTVAMGAGNNNILLPEPERGFIQFGLALFVSNPDGAPRTIAPSVFATTNAPDPWGAWSGTQQYDQRTIAAAAAGIGLRIPTLPVPRGNQLVMQLVGMTGGNNATSLYFFVEMPGELVTVDQMLSSALSRV